MGYIAVDPEGLPDFPYSLGVTGLSTHIPTASLGFAQQDDGSFTLQVDGIPDFGDFLYDSVGVKEGVFDCGLSTCIDGVWDQKYMQIFASRKPIWKGDPLSSEFAYRILYQVSSSTAAYIKACEAEHVEDFRRAWDCSYGYFAAIARFINNPPVRVPGVNEFIDYVAVCMADGGADFLVPQNPSDPDDWSRRLRNVFIELADQSQERDRQGTHHPEGYDLTVSNRGASDGIPTIEVSMRPRPLTGNSEHYINHEWIDIVWSGALISVPSITGAEACESNDPAGAPALMNHDTHADEHWAPPAVAVGDLVVLADGILITMGSAESIYYASATEVDGMTDVDAVRTALEVGSVITAFTDDRNHAWVDIGPTDLYDVASFVKVPVAHLRPARDLNAAIGQLLEQSGSSWSDDCG